MVRTTRTKSEGTLEKGVTRKSASRTRRSRRTSFKTSVYILKIKEVVDDIGTFLKKTGKQLSVSVVSLGRSLKKIIDKNWKLVKKGI